jgi:hypothetical protein
MSTYSTVEIQLTCTRCSHLFAAPAGIVAFSWGAIPETYSAGDFIRWLMDSSGKVFPSMQPVGDAEHLRWNLGDPSIQNLLAFDSDPHVVAVDCASCGAHFDAIAVRIEGGRISKGTVFNADETRQLFGREPSALAIVEIGPGGDYVVHDEWFDPPLRHS